MDPERLVLALTRLRDFLVERRIREVSIPVYDPNKGRLNQRYIYHPARGLCGNRNNRTPTQKVLLERCMSLGWTRGF